MQVVKTLLLPANGTPAEISRPLHLAIEEKNQETIQFFADQSGFLQSRGTHKVIRPLHTAVQVENLPAAKNLSIPPSEGKC